MAFGPFTVSSSKVKLALPENSVAISFHNPNCAYCA